MKYFDRARRELVAASARMSRADDRTRAKTPRMVRLLRHSRRGALVAIGIVALTGSAVAAVISTSGDDNPGQRALKKLPSVSGTHPWVRAFGIDPSSATPAFQSSIGAVSIAENQDVACLLRGTREDQCYLKSNIAGGLGFSIQNDCSVGSARQMIIQGFAPPGVAEVRVAYSDGSTPLSTTVVHGAYLVVGRTPDQGAAYPTRLRYLDAAGTDVATHEIPDGSHLCMSTTP